jgi:hypothetical protein
MPTYVTIIANIEATGAALTRHELDTRPIHHPDPTRSATKEVPPTPTTP